MGKRFSRSEILDRLHSQREKKVPLLAATAGNGLMAKLIEKGGADLILVFGTGYTRMQGRPSIAEQIRPEKELLKEMLADQFEVTENIPLIGGISVSDYPADADLNAIVDEVMDMGLSGITNFQTSGMIENSEFVRLAENSPAISASQKAQHDGEMKLFEKARRFKAEGLGSEREEELLKKCHERGIFTVAYTFTADQARRYVNAGADIIVGHCGGTAGGLVGHDLTLGYEEAGKRLCTIFEAAREVNPDVLIMGHGGPFWNPEATGEMYRLTGCDGFVSGSAVERIPVERAVIGAVKDFKSIVC
ncbi:MAG: phosphoenolpyruvate hydrolase family protein [Lachnospiraceae bacterium]|nr:phosphoenolpyruvate hydrolase family protein [Lachnospiraceae bacterium]